MVLYFNCISKNIDEKISNVLRVIILIIILSLPILLSIDTGVYKDSVHIIVMVSSIFLALMQVLALVCKKEGI